MSEHPPKSTPEHPPQDTETHPEPSPMLHAPVETPPLTPEEAAAIEAVHGRLEKHSDATHETVAAAAPRETAAAVHTGGGRQKFGSMMLEDAKFAMKWPLRPSNWLAVLGLLGSWILHAIKSAPSMAGKGGGGGGGHGGGHDAGGGGHH